MIEYQGKLLVVTGPTASGKSDIALKLAHDINGYIINGDSRQVYKYLDIGTAKPKFDTKKNCINILDGIEHFLFDFVKPSSPFTLFEYQQEVQKILDMKKESKQIPIIVGGSGMYIDCVIFNYDLTPNSKESSIHDERTLEELQDMAKEYKEELNNSDWNNKYRLIRILERGYKNNQKGRELNNKYFVIDIKKEFLEQRIKERVEKMFKDGLEKENKELLEMGYSYSDKAMNSIGYREFEEYFNGGKGIEDVKEEIFRNTIAYVKRQKTWFRRNSNAIWTDSYDLVLKESLNLINTV